jgi:hypothetical protein
MNTLGIAQPTTENKRGGLVMACLDVHSHGGVLPLSATHKLNIASAHDILSIAGSAFQSWTVFVVVAAALACGAIYGDTRTKSRRR